MSDVCLAQLTYRGHSEPLTGAMFLDGAATVASCDRALHVRDWRRHVMWD
jgi:hypothetical protein